jgi:hypothetical protein
MCSFLGSFYRLDTLLTNHVRCTAPANDLDSDQHVVRRSQAHTELLVKEFELGMLWDEYGLVGDIVVRIFSVYYALRGSEASRALPVTCDRLLLA